MWNVQFGVPMAEARPAEEGADPTGFRATNREGPAVAAHGTSPVMFFWAAMVRCWRIIGQLMVKRLNNG